MDNYAPEFTEDQTRLSAADKEAEAEESWSSPGVLPALFVNIAGGFLYGICIGFIPVIFQFNQYLGDCARYTAEDACNALSYTGCSWVPFGESNAVSNTTTNSSFFASTTATSAASDGGYCGFPDYASVNCSIFVDQDQCGDALGGDSCYWRFHKKTCAHLVGWNSNQQGVLAGIQIVGAMISAATAGAITNKIGRKKSLAVGGALTALACLFFSVGWAMSENYGMLLIGELLIGMAAGCVSVICPMYCGEVVSGNKLQQGIGVIFQLFVTFGIFFCGGVGLALDPMDDTATSHAHLQSRFQWIIVLQWFTALVLFPIAWWIPESPLWLRQQSQTGGQPTSRFCADDDDKATPLQEASPLVRGSNGVIDEEVAVNNNNTNNNNNNGDSNNNNNAPSYSNVGGPTEGDATEQESNSLSDLFTKENTIPLLVGLAFAMAQQWTGINAVMLYAPSIAGKLGLTPLLGNFAIGVWNFVTCFIPIPLVQRFSCRHIFIATTGLATVACLLTGIGVMPGVFEDDSPAQHGMGIFGILLFILAFESGIGPCFYVLAQDIFPKKVRSIGTSYCVWVCFACNVVINWGFPVAATGLSGGPSGNQNKGLSMMFMIFFGVGFCCTAFLALKMPKSNSENKKDAAAAAAAAIY